MNGIKRALVQWLKYVGSFIVCSCSSKNTSDVPFSDAAAQTRTLTGYFGTCLSFTFGSIALRSDV